MKSLNNNQLITRPQKTSKTCEEKKTPLVGIHIHLNRKKKERQMSTKKIIRNKKYIQRIFLIKKLILT